MSIAARRRPESSSTTSFANGSRPPPEEAWSLLRPLTRLGQALAELDATVEVPEDVELLGIPKGAHDVQRLVYWHFAKLFWNEGSTFEENIHVNFDWYHPRFAHRHTEDEVRGWFADRGLEIMQAGRAGSGVHRARKTRLASVRRDHGTGHCARVVPMLDERPSRRAKAPPLVGRGEQRPQMLDQRLDGCVDHRKIAPEAGWRQGSSQPVERGKHRPADGHRLDGEAAVPPGVELVDDDRRSLESRSHLGVAHALKQLELERHSLFRKTGNRRLDVLGSLHASGRMARVRRAGLQPTAQELPPTRGDRRSRTAGTRPVPAAHRQGPD